MFIFLAAGVVTSMKLGRRSTTFAAVFGAGVALMADLMSRDITVFFSMASGGGVVPVFDVAAGLTFARKAMCW